MTEFLGIYWASLNKLFLLPVFIVVIFFIIKNYFYKKNNINTILHSDNVKTIFSFFSFRRLFIKTVLLILSLIFLFLAALQPQWSKKDILVEQEGRDLLIALDVSKSMLAKDFKPDRLEFVKLKVRNLLNKLDFERVGLILFSGLAFLQCPLTTDKAAFLMFLDQVDAEMISSGTTAIDNAILKALDVFSKTREKKNKLLFLVTDGEDFSLHLNTVKEKAKQENIIIFTYGVGSEKGAPIPILDGNGNQIGHELDFNGEIAISKLNEKVLSQIAKELSGKYLKASQDNSDLNHLIGIIKSYEKEKFEDKKISYYQDQYPWFLAVTFICLALEWIL